VRHCVSSLKTSNQLTAAVESLSSWITIHTVGTIVV
jgi:hypothetical protein